MTHRLIIDTDPGVDDTLALILASISPEIKIEALTITSGNNSVTQCTHNALCILDILNPENIPVYSGRSRDQDNQEGKTVNGVYGLGKLNLSPSAIHSKKLPAADAIIELIETNPHELSLLLIAPMTNFADALKRKPAIANQVKNVVIMGGAVWRPGNNFNKMAECNVFNDVFAAHTVLNSGANITLIPLDVTTQALLRRSQFDTIIKQCQKEGMAKFLTDLLCDYIRKRPYCEDEDVGVLHDPLALTYLLRPELFTLEELRVDMVTDEGDNYGRTIVTNGSPNVNVAFGLNQKAFDQFFTDALIKFVAKPI